MPDLSYDPNKLTELPSDELHLNPGNGWYLRYHIQSAQLEEENPDRKPEIGLLRYFLDISEKALEKPAFYTTPSIALQWLKGVNDISASGNHWASRLKNRYEDLGFLLRMPCPEDAKFVMQVYIDLYFPKRTFLPRNVLTDDKINMVRVNGKWQKAEEANTIWKPLNEIAQRSIDFMISAGPEVNVTEVLEYTREEYMKRKDILSI
jgi:hypothetical protein